MRATLAVVALLAAAAHAKGPAPTPAPARAWLGTFVATDKVAPCGCAQVSGIGRAGHVVVLAPGDGGAPADGDVVVVSPLLGSIATGTIVAGKVVVPWFVTDRRDNDDGVLVLPATTRVAFVEPRRADALAISQKIQRDDLENVHRAVAALEIGAIDVDGDGVADFAVTYGCTAWWDGTCQSHGQFFLARRGAKWVEIE